MRRPHSARRATARLARRPRARSDRRGECDPRRRPPPSAPEAAGRTLPSSRRRMVLDHPRGKFWHTSCVSTVTTMSLTDASRRALLIEGDDEYAALMSTLLDREGWEISRERDPLSGLEQLQAGPNPDFDVILVSTPAEPANGG